jgi:monothiol glutaredoxin
MTQEEALKFIDEKVKGNDVVLFMKGTADFPMCGFSGRVVQILRTLGVKFESVDVLSNESLRSAIKDYTSWPTIPQLYIKQEFVGGCDITTQMAQSGDLQKLLAEKGIGHGKSV